MISLAKRLLQRALPRQLYRALRIELWDDFGRKSYAQEGEDLILASILGMTSKGFYVDVGASHPIRYSNTWALYKQGWRGVNIDANPEMIRLLGIKRSRDINLHSAVGGGKDLLTYYTFKAYMYNTCIRSVAEKLQEKTGRPYQTTEVNSLPLSDILDSHLPPGQSIDLLNVDVEGMEMDALRSNNWSRYRPTVIVVEYRDGDIRSLCASEVCGFLESLDYVPVARTPLSAVFRSSPKPVTGP